MTEPDAYQVNIARGAQLLAVNRPREAIAFFQTAIAMNPDHPLGYVELARSWNEIPMERSKSIAAIDKAISLAPETSYFFGLKAWFLVCMMLYRSALETAQRGVAISPTCLQSLNSLANAYTKLNEWRNAEAFCLRILAIDPHNAPALNLLAQTLRHQNRWKESRLAVARLLAELPNDAFGHANAGYAALASGDYLRANQHFLNSLRMDPFLDIARRGLLSSLRSRIWINQLNLRIFGLLQRPVTAGSLTLLISVAILFTAILYYFCQESEKARHGGAENLFGTLFGLAAAYAYLCTMTVWMGNFLIMFDPLGKHALRGEDMTKAYLLASCNFFLIFFFLVIQLWSFAFGLFFVTSLLACSIYFPLLYDRYLLRRERGII